LSPIEKRPPLQAKGKDLRVSRGQFRTIEKTRKGGTRIRKHK